MNAKGIFDRNNLTENDFDFEGGKNMRKLARELKNMKYDPNRDYKPYKDMFEPCSQPTNEYLRLPVDIKIEFIDTEDKIG